MEMEGLYEFRDADEKGSGKPLKKGLSKRGGQ